jgi:HAD superfamily phosphoserine phosphatase-like hydrolase
MKVAVFDVCGTLYDSNTTFDFLDFVFKDSNSYQLFKYIYKSFIVKLIAYPFYRFFHYDIIRAIATLFLRGKRVDEVEKLAQAFIDSYLEKKKIAYTHHLLKEYQKRGFELVLMSGSYDIVVSKIAKKLQISSFYASRLQREDDILTGRYEEDILWDKATILKRAYPSISTLVVVSDNRSDYALLKRAQSAIAIVKKHKMVAFWQKSDIKNIKIVGLDGKIYTTHGLSDI